MALHTLLKTQHGYPPQANDMAGYELTMEEKLVLIDKSINNGMPQAYNKWDQINMNVAKMAPDNMVQFDGREKMPRAPLQHEPTPLHALQSVSSLSPLKGGRDTSSTRLTHTHTHPHTHTHSHISTHTR